MFRLTLGLTFAAALTTTAATSAAAGVEGARALVPHRAVYDLKLKDVSERSGIEGMYGRMVYEFTGSACTGFTTNFRFVTRTDTGEDMRTTDQQTTTFENADLKEFRFETKSFTDEQLDKQVSGEATNISTGVKVELMKPDNRELDLTPSQFPTQHMLDVLDNARKGKRFFEARIFDGSEDGDKSLLTSTVVGQKQTPKPDDSDASQAGQFSKQAYWPVTIAYFNDSGSGGDAVPVYRMSFKLYDNGITRDLTMDYGDFVLTGQLSKLEVLDRAPDCK